MDKKRIITIAGKPGSGKSSTSRRLAETLGYRHFSSGELFRAIAKERGVDIYQVNVLAETEQAIDRQVDEQLRVLGETDNELVIDSRMAWHWIPESFKVYLDLDIAIAAARIIENGDPVRLEAEHVPDSVATYTTQLEQRLASESKRYQSLYGANPYDTSNYDLVVDSAKHDIPGVVQQVLDTYETWLNE